MFYGEGFMIIPEYKFHGFRLKKAMLEAEDFTRRDIILYKTFSNALKKMPNDLDETQFFNHFDCISEDLSDILCFYIIVANLSSLVFERDKYYVSELCLSLVMKDVLPLKYAEYAKFFLSDPVYSLIMKINAAIAAHDYLTLIGEIIKHFDLCNLDEGSYNEIIKTLHKILEEKYYILLTDCYTLEDIYIKLYQAMIAANKKGYPFTKSDFETLNALRGYIDSNDQELISLLKEQLLASEDEYNDNLSIIRNCLKIISEHQKVIIPINLYRRKKYEKN